VARKSGTGRKDLWTEKTSRSEFVPVENFTKITSVPQTVLANEKNTLNKVCTCSVKSKQNTRNAYIIIFTTK